MSSFTKTKTTGYFRQADGVVVVFDITDKSSFASMILTVIYSLM